MSKDIFLELVREDQENDLRIITLEERLEEARALLFEAVDKYPVEENKPDFWTTRVREWLGKNA